MQLKHIICRLKMNLHFQQVPNSSYSYNTQPPPNMTPNYTSNNIPLTNVQNVPTMDNQAGYGYSTGTNANIQNPQSNLTQQSQQPQLPQQPMQQPQTPQQPMQQQQTTQQPIQHHNMIPPSGQFQNNHYGGYSQSQSVREPNSQDYSYDEHGSQGNYQNNRGHRSSSVPRSESQTHQYHDKRGKGQIFKNSESGYNYPRRNFNNYHHPYHNKYGNNGQSTSKDHRQSKIPSRVSTRSPNPRSTASTSGSRRIKPIDAGQQLYDGSIREQDTVLRGKEIEILNPT